MSVERIRIIVVLPAPFGPSRAKIGAFGRPSRSTPSRTTVVTEGLAHPGRDDGR